MKIHQWRVRLGVLIVVAVIGVLWLTGRGSAIARPPLQDPDPAQPLAVTVRVRPAAQAVDLGEPFTLTVEIADLTAPLSAFQFDLEYDPALVEPTGTNVGSFLASTGRTLICPEAVQPRAGIVRLACVGAGEADGPVGNGSLVTLSFTAVGVGDSPFTLSALQLAGEGVPPLPIAATSQGGQVTILAAPAVAMGGSQTLVGAPGMAVTHTFTLTNLGNYSDTFALTVTGNEWATTPVTDTSAPVAAGRAVTVQVRVDIPASIKSKAVIVGSDTFTLTATSGWDANVTASAQGTTLLNINPAVGLGGVRAGVGLVQSQVVYALTVTNQGDYTDTLALSVHETGWEAALSASSSQPLSAGGVFSFTLTISIPQVVSGTQDVATVLAVSGLDPGVTDTIRVTTTARTAALPGYRIYLPLIVKDSQGR